jgi:thiamine-monophosphate kinase
MPPSSVEDSWIAYLRDRTPQAPTRRMPVGIGDDAAIWRPRPGWDVVLTVDAQAEGTHFRRDWIRLAEIGRRAVSASVSDLAAMAAEPGAILVSILADASLDDAGFRSLYSGIISGARRYGIAIAGGNISRGPLSITVTSIGEVEKRHAILRNGLHPGNEIWVTGSPGLARLGLETLAHGVLTGRFAARAVAAWRDPRARLAEARALARSRALTALVDLSDGLAKDLEHLCVETERRGGRSIGIEIEARELRVIEPTTSLALRAGLDPVEIALQGGEDYELCFATKAKGRSIADGIERRFGLPVRRIGCVVEDEGLWLNDEGTRRRIRVRAFEHFEPNARPSRRRRSNAKTPRDRD